MISYVRILSMDKKTCSRLTSFFYELGTLRKIERSHQQKFLLSEPSDNIASHSFLTAVISYFLARMEDKNFSKAILLGLIHDLNETRTGDLNYINKQYVSVLEEKLSQDQLETLAECFGFAKLVDEYHSRSSVEADIAKDADVLAQEILVKEYAWRGNQTAEYWLIPRFIKRARDKLKTDSGKKVFKVLLDQEPVYWWKDLHGYKDELKSLGSFFYEMSSLRTLPRSHKQTLLTSDESDNIASHIFRVSLISWFMANLEKADENKVLVMALLHDIEESRGGDQNWVYKKFVKVNEEKIRQDQLRNVPCGKETLDIIDEYDQRNSKESQIAKDADLLDQILLLKEYYWAGNKEAQDWLHLDGKSEQEKLLSSSSAKMLAEEIKRQEPSFWWSNSWTNKRQ